MSQTTHIEFYCNKPHEITRIIRVCVEIVGAVELALLTKTTQPDSEWKRYCQSLESDEEDDSTPMEIVARNCPVDVIKELYDPRRRLIADLIAPEFVREFGQLLSQETPSAIRGDCSLSGVFARVGWHDIFDTRKGVEGGFIDRAWFALSLYESGTPRDAEEYAAIIPRLECISAIRNRIQKTVGMVNVCVYSNV